MNPKHKTPNFKLMTFCFDLGVLTKVVDVNHKPTLLAMVREHSAVYRVCIMNPRHINVMCFDIDKVDDAIEGVYDSLDDLPKWVQERIALLSMMSFKPPTEHVSGIGRRISEDTYWVERPDS